MILVFLAMVVTIIVIVIVVKTTKHGSLGHKPWSIEPPEKRAGRKGEITATKLIRSVLREGDCLLSNVRVSYGEKITELDNVIINRYGVFIIEVKSYKGRLRGQEDDYEWKKYKEDGYGNTFVKTVKNPIRQVKRQVYILAKYLQFYGVDVWVEGYALLIQGNSPVDSPRVLKSLQDIDRAIHTEGRNQLDAQTIVAVERALADD